jgi:hypothetical protein
MTALASLLALAGIGFVRSLGVSGWSVIDAALMGGLGYLVRKRQGWALVVGALLFLAGSLYAMKAALSLGAHQGGLTGATLVRVMLFVPMLRALPVVFGRK